VTTRHVALLRGVNVGGRTSMKMSALREAFTDLGFGEVATYIQSGNVVFTSDAPVDADELGRVLTEALDRELTVMVRTAAELQAAIDATPFASAPPAERHLGFLATVPDRSTVDGLDLAPFAPETAEVVGSEVHLHLPNGMGRAKLPSYFGRVLGGDVTYRNWNTVTKLAELSSSTGC
jgi:uncharacterized protein (DUF1697 family)